jgi:AcrR family transcriptional regulator
MEQIADATDIAKGTLYNYFPAKEAILAAYLDQESVARNIERIVRLRGLADTRSRLTASLAELIEAVRARPDMFEKYFTYRMRDRGLPLPRAAVASSPWLDLTCSADSYRRNARKDISLLGSWDVWSRYYAGTANPRDPWISPLYGGLAGLPPILIQVGTNEIMLDDAVGFTELARDAGVDATLRVWPGMVHCFAFFSPMVPEATAGMNEMGAFIRAKLEHATAAAGR